MDLEEELPPLEIDNKNFTKKIYDSHDEVVDTFILIKDYIDENCIPITQNLTSIGLENFLNRIFNE